MMVMNHLNVLRLFSHCSVSYNLRVNARRGRKVIYILSTLIYDRVYI